MKTDVHFSSKTDDWATPQDFFDKIQAEFHLQLDVCADKKNKKCKQWWGVSQNVLGRDWDNVKVGGKIKQFRKWMNPPYGKEIGKWVKKAAESKTLTVALLPARTDTKWFHEHIYGKAEVRFIKGRLKFGNSKNSAPFPSMIVIFNPIN